MPSASFQRHLPHAAGDLIAFVCDVQRYPEFINVISAIRVLGGRKTVPNGERFEAEMKVAYKFLSESVRCSVNSDREAGTVTVRKSGNDGAISRLTNDWVFHSLSDGTTLLEFDVDVTLKSSALNFMARQKFEEISTKMVAKFIARAGQICPVIDSDKDVSEQIAALGFEGFS